MCIYTHVLGCPPWKYDGCVVVVRTTMREISNTVIASSTKKPPMLAIIMTATAPAPALTTQSR